MTLSLTQSLTAVAPFVVSSFLGIGGTEPYLYSVSPNGAGGTIDPSTGLYTAPDSVSEDPAFLYDTVVVTDYIGATASSQILVGSPLLLFCEVLQKEMGLDPSKVYLWDQKINQPTDSSLYIAVSVPACKSFGNANSYMPVDGSGLLSQQSVNMLAQLDIDLISRSPAARDRKEEVILALNSVYSQQQQEANSFYIATLHTSGGFKNLSQVDGAAIPYRYQLTVNLQYCFTKTSSAAYFDTFNTPVTNTNS